MSKGHREISYEEALLLSKMGLRPEASKWENPDTWWPPTPTSIHVFKDRKWRIEVDEEA